jgi:hypothetical protein
MMYKDRNPNNFGKSNCNELARLNALRRNKGLNAMESQKFEFLKQKYIRLHPAVTITWNKNITPTTLLKGTSAKIPLCQPAATNILEKESKNGELSEEDLPPAEENEPQQHLEPQQDLVEDALQSPEQYESVPPLTKKPIGEIFNHDSVSVWPDQSTQETIVEGEIQDSAVDSVETFTAEYLQSAKEQVESTFDIPIHMKVAYSDWNNVSNRHLNLVQLKRGEYSWKPLMKPIYYIWAPDQLCVEMNCSSEHCLGKLKARKRFSNPRRVHLLNSYCFLISRVYFCGTSLLHFRLMLVSFFHS